MDRVVPSTQKNLEARGSVSIKQGLHTASSFYSSVCCPWSLFYITIKFPCNAHSDWLKQRALSVNRTRVDDGMDIIHDDGFQSFATEI